MCTVKQYNALILGSGQGGTPLTMALAAAGHTVALVEASHIGKLLISYKRQAFHYGHETLLL